MAILKKRLETVYIELIAELGSMDITVRDVLNLQKGDIIKLETVKVDDDMVLKIGNRKKFYARPGVVGTHMAVQITGRIGEEQDEVEVFKEIEEEK